MMTYNLTKDTCDRCGITKEEAKRFPVNTGIDHPEYRYSTSFALGFDGSVLCARCHKEEQLESLFALMDKRSKK